LATRETEKQEEDAETDGEGHGIQIDGPEAHRLGLLGAVCATPQEPSGNWPIGQVLQVMLDVLSRRVRFRGHDQVLSRKAGLATSQANCPTTNPVNMAKGGKRIQANPTASQRPTIKKTL
jgi:hypothetical protein